MEEKGEINYYTQNSDVDKCKKAVKRAPNITNNWLTQGRI